MLMLCYINIIYTTSKYLMAYYVSISTLQLLSNSTFSLYRPIILFSTLLPRPPHPPKLKGHAIIFCLSRPFLIQS